MKINVVFLLVVAVGPQDEALCSLAHATNVGSLLTHSKWRCNLNGTPRTSPCENSWPGLVCEMGAVISISLPDLRFGGYIPAKLFSLTSLKYLDLSGNHLTGSLPSNVGDASQLEYLNIGQNVRLNGTIPASIGQLHLLQHLILRDNMVNGELPTTIQQLSKLKFLTISITSLGGTLPSFLGSLTSLEYLQLYGNSFTGTIPPEISFLSRLKVMDLHNNFLTGPIPLELSSITSLEVCLLVGNAVTGTNPFLPVKPVILTDHQFVDIVFRNSSAGASA